MKQLATAMTCIAPYIVVLCMVVAIRWYIKDIFQQLCSYLASSPGQVTMLLYVATCHSLYRPVWLGVDMIRWAKHYPDFNKIPQMFQPQSSSVEINVLTKTIYTNQSEGSFQKHDPSVHWNMQVGMNKLPNLSLVFVLNSPRGYFQVY